MREKCGRLPEIQVAIQDRMSSSNFPMCWLLQEKEDIPYTVYKYIYIILYPILGTKTTSSIRNFLDTMQQNSAENLIAGFKISGIYPLDKDQVVIFCPPPLPPPPPPSKKGAFELVAETLAACSNSFLGYLRTIRERKRQKAKKDEN